jgi:hypothetical protein
LPIWRRSHVSALVLLIAVEGIAQVATDRTAATIAQRAVPYSDAPYIIDGVLDDEIWQQALAVELDIETSPRENVPAPVRTTAYLVEDHTYLLIAFDAKDPDPSKIRAYLRDRDSAFNDDFVGVVLDTFNDERYALEFFTNALGVQMDLTNDDVNGGEDESWDAIWAAEGRITAEGYTVEMAIPYSQLRFPRSDGEQTWGIDLLRFYPREDRVRISNNAQVRGRNCYLCQFSKFTGFAEAEPGRGLEIAPSLTATRSDRRDETQNVLLPGSTDSDVGVNVQWGITENLTANLAINPDFSQVEADVPQLDVNNRFALFFPETRPFFLEAADFFATPINAIFTRTVADPDAGAKLTGRSGKSTFGLFAAEDAVTNLLFPDSLGSSTEVLEQSNRAFAGRYSYGLGSSSTVGAVLTSRTGADYQNDVVGIDGRFRVNDSHNIRAQFLNSETDYPAQIASEFTQPDSSFGGGARRVSYQYNSRLWFANANYESLDATFRADLGFVRQVDIERRIVGFGRIWHGSDYNWWNRLQIGTNTGSLHDGDDHLQNRFSEVFFSLQGPWQSFLQSGFSEQREFWDGNLYDANGSFMFGQIRPVSGLSINLSMNRGDQVDFSNSRLGKQLNIAPGVEWNINRHLLLRLRHTFASLDTQAGDNIFEAQLNDLRLTWQFNTRSFLRLAMQERKVERNLAAYNDPDTERYSQTLGTQLLYSYKLNPRTVFFVGYSDNQIEDDERPDMTTLDRTLFLKLSYAWMP